MNGVCGGVVGGKDREIERERDAGIGLELLLEQGVRGRKKERGSESGRDDDDSLDRLLLHFQ